MFEVILLTGKFIIGWIITIIGLIGWIIPLPFVPFFLLFFFGLHILGYDKKFYEYFKKIKKKDTIKK